ncbi:aldehyde dehydrogenase family protein [Streptomyces sp. NPDC005373]|uniref:aldehyde dehydrogenase family protein n=1 Tax=unclassified Streptomyces TaxID=2593676 RepID=UPI0033BA07DB
MGNAGESPRGLLIGGEWHKPSNGSYPVVNPATEDVIAEAPEASSQDVESAVQAAKDAFPAWSRTPAEERGKLLARAADLVEQRAEEILTVAQAETGATMATARAMQVPVTVRRLRRYSRIAFETRDQALLPQPVAASSFGPGALVSAVAARRPVGVVGAISPYNFPIGTSAGKLAPALASGNTVVLKPPPQDPLAVLLLGEILTEAGFPPGVINIISGSGPETGQALVDSPDVDLISFTGSTAVGTKIAEAGGRTMKRLFLELGGKGAALVLPDADVDLAVKSIAATWMFQSGQGCVLPTRAIIHRSLYDTVVEKLAGLADSLKVGDPLAADTVVGPLISDRQRTHVESLVQSARDEGARIAAGGERPDLAKGFYVAPTLIADAIPEMTAVRTEAFGPVIAAMPFDTEEEAIELANDTQFGLHNYVFSRDLGRAYGIAGQLRSGYVTINTAQQHPEAPFGGFKYSGLGRDGGAYSLDAYTEQQSVVWV